MADVIRLEAALGPLEVELRQDLHVTRQKTRGGPRYIVHDPVSFQNHAFDADDYRILTAITAKRSLRRSFQILVEDGTLEESDRQGFYEFVLWLHRIAIVQLPIDNGDKLFERRQRKEAARRQSWYSSFLNHRIPLCCPDRFLDRTLRYTGWLFTRPGLAIWAALLTIVLFKCAGRMDELFAHSTNLLALSNLPILWIALVVLKGLHELGHAYACKKFGGEVPEMGIVFILMTPCAYVDANASWKLPHRGHRIAVAMAGMYIESIIAAVFALIWAGTAPGLMHDIALNVVFLATVVTLLLNLNPLMKFDGYYIFSDILAVFNLQERSAVFLKGWTRKLALGIPAPVTDYSRSERWLYGLYGPSAFVYRVMLAFLITSMVMLQWPGAGLFLGAIFTWALMAQPVLRLVRYLWSCEGNDSARTRARLVAVTTVVTAGILVSVLPISSSVTVSGVLDPQTRSSIRAPASGFLDTIAVENGMQVRQGSVLTRLVNPELEYRQLRLRGERDAERVSLDVVELDDATRAASHRSRLAYLNEGVAELDEQIASLEIRAPITGTIVKPERLASDGAFMRQGEELFQIHSGHQFVRIVLTDYELSRARLDIGSEAEVRWTCNPGHTSRGIVREIRRTASRDDIPLALTMLAGGDVYAKPNSDGSGRATQPYLHVFLEVDSAPLEREGAGLTARVHLDARVEVLSAWVRRRFLTFWNAWRMS